MLAYKTVAEAELALSRSLTYAESLWVKYSADKSDFTLYCHNLLILCLVYSSAPLPFVLVELLRSPKLDRYKIQPKVRFSPSELFDCYKAVMKTFFLSVGTLQLLSYPAIKVVGIRTGLDLPSGREIVAQLLVYVVVEDYSNYWIHRWLHSAWGYENIHRVHHEFSAPTALAAPYAHWAEIIILGLPSFLGPALVPCHILTFWFWFVCRQIEALDTHSGYDFPWNPTKFIPFYGGAEYHDYHHNIGGFCQSNFASVFTYCDYIYGTDRGYWYQKKLLKKMQEETWNDKLHNGLANYIPGRNLKPRIVEIH